jgi:hypothetical protein
MRSLRHKQADLPAGGLDDHAGFTEQEAIRVFARETVMEQRGTELTIEDVTLRATQTGSLLEGILSHAGVVPHSQWGLNE